ncbi:alpha/beta hydrolase [Kitasatospora sp. GP82]|uniref:alpha/beta hydrolase n=1 Tax=Kitasatospora sp. GP82 TaxID=3035089 RepID=UPI002474A926|nr:alpha/beta hydrolase [Kitasatospora sp. GP82]MDH6126660.1 hypothetical protein [Kitasatospora sp. GP82]
MVDFGTLHSARPGALRAAADAYDALGLANEVHHEVIKDAVRWISHGGNWTGSAAEAATTALTRTNRRLDGSHTALQGMGILLRNAAEAFELAQAKLLSAADEAGRAGFTVGPDGVVGFPPPRAADRHDPDYHDHAPSVRARALTTRISAAIAEADAADRQVAALLDRLAVSARDGFALGPDAAATRLDRIRSLGRKLTDAGWPAADATPAQVHDWWQGLTPAEQQRLITDHPDLLGGLDGVPAAARDQANRLVLARLLDTYRSRPQPLSPADQRKLDGFETIQRRLTGGFPDGGGPGSRPPLLLLALGEQGQGRAVLSWGDPDTARHVSALVPGLNSTLAGIGAGDASTALRVHAAAAQAQSDAGEVPSTASIIWLGYDAPLLDGASVASMDRAVEGAAAYDRFLSGLRSSHQGPEPAHVTAIGHSYGSLLVGQAAQRTSRLSADDVVLVGSPGTGAERASQFSVGADHVYVGSAGHDPVSHLPSPRDLVATGVGAVVVPPFGAAAGHRAADPHGLWFGQDPASAEFGARCFEVADGSVEDSHDSYFGKNGKGGPSLQNIGRIVGGRADRISPAQGR